MGPVSAEIEIDTPREQVFATLVDLAARPSFTDHFLTDFHLTRIDGSGIGAGARFRVDAPPRKAWMDTTARAAEAPLRKVWRDTTVVDVEEPFRAVEEGRGGRGNRIPNHTVWELTEGAGGLT